MAEKGVYIKDIQDGNTVDGLFMIKDVNRYETRNGSPYLTLNLIDRSGEIQARVWDRADDVLAQCAPGSVVRVSGQAQSYKDSLQLRVSRLDAVEEGGVDPELFLPSVKGDTREMATELLGIALKVEDAWYRSLLEKILHDPTFMEQFRKAPAAKQMHHAYVGGLLEHTLAVTRLAGMVSGFYPSIDGSLLITGAIVHDMGKVKELSLFPRPFHYTEEGRLVGHMVIAVEMLGKWIDALPGFPEDAAVRLKHLILSHHGRHEFGAPTLPMMLEAFVLNFIDDLDAKINYFDRLSSSASTGEYQWSDYQKNLERFLLVKGHGDKALLPSPSSFHPGSTASPVWSRNDAEQMEDAERDDDAPAGRKTKKAVPPPTDTRQEKLF